MQSTIVMKTCKRQAVVAVVAVNRDTLVQNMKTGMLYSSNKESDCMIVIMLFVKAESNRKLLCQKIL